MLLKSVCFMQGRGVRKHTKLKQVKILLFPVCVSGVRIWIIKTAGTTEELMVLKLADVLVSWLESIVNVLVSLSCICCCNSVHTMARQHDQNQEKMRKIHFVRSRNLQTIQMAKKVQRLSQLLRRVKQGFYRQKTKDEHTEIAFETCF